MKIPSTIQQFFDVFATYNTAIWPVQILAYVLGILVLAPAWHGKQTLVIFIWLPKIQLYYVMTRKC